MNKRSRRKNIGIKILNAFDFSKTEQRGIIILFILLLLLFVFRFFLAYNQKNNASVEVENLEIKSFLQRQQEYRDSILLLRNQKYTSAQNTYNSNEKTSKKRLSPFNFDPNTLPLSGWVKLGFSQKQAQQIINYRSKGGYFYKKTDLKKMYCITEEDFQVLENYINITTNHKQETEEKKEKPQKVLKLELNTADSINLQQIYGIGAKTASQIVKYREKLGGYVAINQLKEVYAIDSNRYLQIVGYLYVNSESVRKININKASIKELSNHPYIEYYLAKTIVNHREKNGNYADIKEIKKAALIYDELYFKIAPYLSVE